MPAANEPQEFSPYRVKRSGRQSAIASIAKSLQGTPPPSAPKPQALPAGQQQVEELLGRSRMWGPPDPAKPLTSGDLDDLLSRNRMFGGRAAAPAAGPTPGRPSPAPTASATPPATPASDIELDDLLSRNRMFGGQAPTPAPPPATPDPGPAVDDLLGRTRMWGAPDPSRPLSGGDLDALLSRNSMFGGPRPQGPGSLNPPLHAPQAPTPDPVRPGIGLSSQQPTPPAPDPIPTPRLQTRPAPNQPTGPAAPPLARPGFLRGAAEVAGGAIPTAIAAQYAADPLMSAYLDKGQSRPIPLKPEGPQSPEAGPAAKFVADQATQLGTGAVNLGNQALDAAKGFGPQVQQFLADYGKPLAIGGGISLAALLAYLAWKNSQGQSEEEEQLKYAGLDLAKAFKNEFVRGFLTHEAEQGASESQVRTKIAAACVSRHVAAEFEKVAFSLNPFSQKVQVPPPEPAPARPMWGVDPIEDVETFDREMLAQDPEWYEYRWWRANNDPEAEYYRALADALTQNSTQAVGEKVATTAAGFSYKPPTTAAPAIPQPKMPDQSSVPGIQVPRGFDMGGGRRQAFTPPPDAAAGTPASRPPGVPQTAGAGISDERAKYDQFLASRQQAATTAQPNHPYWSHYGADGKRVSPVPERIGGMRTSSPQDLYDDWWKVYNGNFSPETQQAWTSIAGDNLSDTSPAAIQKRQGAAAAHHLRERFPQLGDPDAPRPSPQELAAAYYELPDEYRDGLLELQRSEIANWSDPQLDPTGRPMMGQAHGAVPSVGFRGNPYWQFPPKPERIHAAYDERGMPRLLNPEDYANLPELADRYGINLASKDFRGWWDEQKARDDKAYQQALQGDAGGIESYLNEVYRDPQGMLRDYWFSRENRMRNADVQAQLDDPLGGAMDYFGNRRIDPRTGQFAYHTPDTDKNFGTNSEGIFGDAQGALFGGVGMGLGALTGDYDRVTGGARDALAGINHGLGTDIGHDLNSRSLGSGVEDKSAIRGSAIPTTTGNFVAPYDPLTQRYKEDHATQSSDAAKYRAMDPNGNAFSRTLAAMEGQVLDKGPDALTAYAGMRATGAVPGGRLIAKRPWLGPAVERAAINQLDPTLAGESLGVRAGQAGTDFAENFALPITANPAWTAADHLIRQETPGARELFQDMPEIMRAEGYRSDASAPYRFGMLAGGGALNALPELAIDKSRLPLGKAIGGQTGAKLQELGQTTIGDASNFAGLPVVPDLLALRNMSPDDMFAARERILAGVERSPTEDRQFGQQEMRDAAAIDASRVLPKQRSFQPENMPTSPDLSVPIPEDWQNRFATAVQTNDPAAAQVFNRLYEAYLPQVGGDEASAQRLAAQYAMAVLARDQRLAGMQKSNSARELLRRTREKRAMPTSPYLEDVLQIPSSKLPLNPQTPQVEVPKVPEPAKVPTTQPTAAPTPAPKPPTPPPAAAAPTPMTTPPATPGAAPQAAGSPQVNADRASAFSPPQPTAPPIQPAAPAPTAQKPAAPAQTAPQPPAAAPAPTQNPAAPTTATPAADNSWFGTFDSLTGGLLTSFSTAPPEQKQEMIAGAVGEVEQSKSLLGQGLELLQGGQLSPEALRKQTAQKLVDNGGVGSVEEAMQAAGNMDLGQQILLFGGLSLGAVGLISALTSEDGGIMPWLLAILGLGGAAFGAGNAGLLGQGALDFTEGIRRPIESGVGSLLGQEQPQTIDPASVKRVMGMVDYMPDSMVSPALIALTEQHPELADQLDAAFGGDSWGDSALSVLGNLTGETDRRFAEYGITPQRQERLSKLWQAYRNPGTPAAATAY